MPFYILVDNNLTEHQFEYLKPSATRRLDATLVPGKEPQEEASPLRSDSYAIEIMSKKLQSLDQTESAAKAIEVFKKLNIHHLPVMKDDQFRGLVSDRDIFWLERFELAKHNSLKEFMSKTVLCCGEETPISHLAKVMVHEKVSALPVMNQDGKLKGIITHNDILKWVYRI